MGIIRSNVKKAFDVYQQDGNLQNLIKKIVADVDYSVRFAWQMSEALDAIRQTIPNGTFEVLFYDGENGEYRLLDFNPAGLSKDELTEKIESALRYQVGVESDYIDKAMDSVYLVPDYALIKVDIFRGEI